MTRRKKRRSSNGQKRGIEEWQPTGPCGFDQLPPALVMDILSGLSAKTLCSCRCVCKSWLLLISDPGFHRLHHSRSPMGMGILIKTYPRPNWKQRKLEFTQIVECSRPDLQLERMSFSPKVSIPIIDDKIGDSALINSCNGLVCLVGSKHRSMYVCNPILGEFITTPPLVNGLETISFIGLGFNAATNDYKVISTDSSRRAQLYTIGTGVWRDIGEAPFQYVQAQFDAFLHGALHWTVPNCKRDEFIQSFNFETEKFETIPPPSRLATPNNMHGKPFTLGVFQGCLLLSVFDYHSRKVDMWVMRDYGVKDSWSKIFDIYLPIYIQEYEAMMFLSNGDLLMSYYSYGDGAVVCYNPQTKGLRETSIAPIGSAYFATSYSPSFVSLCNIAKGEEVKRIRNNENLNKLFSEVSSSAAGSGMSAHQCTNLNSGSCPAGVEGALP